MLRTLTGIKSLLLLLFISVSISQTVSLQGVLREPSGNTVQDGHFSLTFNLYDQNEGGSALWTETHGSVPVKHGVYAVELGSLTSFNDLTFSVQYYVGISVQSGAELTPRVKLTNSPTTMAVFGVENVFPSSGNVGVGTTDPQAMLHIEGSGSMLKLVNGSSVVEVDANGVLLIPNSINFADGSVLSTAQGGSASALSSPGNATVLSDSDDDGTGDIQFFTGSTKKMEIKGGNAGIDLLAGTSIYGDLIINPGYYYYDEPDEPDYPAQNKIYINLLGGNDGTGGTIHPASSGYGYIGVSNANWMHVYTTNIHRTNELTLSDRSTKLNIRSLIENRSTSTNLDKVLALNPVKYDINMDTHPFFKDVELKEGQLEDSKNNLGFIAQELMEVIPEMVVFDKDYQLYTIRNYEQMFPIIVGAMQEMKAENDDLKLRIERLELLLNKE